MATIKKPNFPNPTVQELNDSLEQLSKTIQSSKKPDGKVDVAALEHTLDASGNAALELGLDRIKDAFRRTEMRSFHDGCSGGTVTRPVKVTPKELDAGEVNSVLSAIAQAKSKVNTLDTNHDGKIQQGEAKGAAGLAGLAGKLAEGALAGTLTAYRFELRAWNEALNDVAHSVKDRKSFDGALQSAAKHHAATDLGADAITWAYRDLATQGKSADIWDLKDSLENAETSFLRYIPFFGRNVKTKAGHLSDKETARLLDTSDLASFIEHKKTAVANRIGGGFEKYLEGKDLAGVDQLADPDFHHVSSTC